MGGFFDGNDEYAGAIDVAILASTIVRFARSRGEERQQLKWFGYFVVLPLAAFIVFATIRELELAPALRVGLEVLGGLSFAVLLAGIPVAAGIAIFKYRLYDIDILIRRTLIYSALTLALAAIYFGSVALLQFAFGALTGEQQSALVTVLSTLGIAALFVPVRRRIQQAIDRRFYRNKYDAAKVLAAFSATVREEVDLELLTERLLEVVHETMQPASASVWLKGSNAKAPRRQGAKGEPPPHSFGGAAHGDGG